MPLLPVFSRDEEVRHGTVTAAKNEPTATPGSLRVFAEGGTRQLVAQSEHMCGFTLAEMVQVYGLMSGALIWIVAAIGSGLFVRLI